MKKLFIYLMILISFTVYGTDYVTSTNGAWEVNTTWVGTQPSCTLASNDKITITNGDTVFTNCVLVISGTPTIIVEGVLTLNGVFVTGNVNFDIKSGGKVIINGVLSFSGNSTVDVKNNGSIIVNGGVISNGGAYDFLCNGYVEINGYGCDKCTVGVPDVGNCVALELEQEEPAKTNEGVVEINFNIVPNPSNLDGFNLVFNGYMNNNANITIQDFNGKTAYIKSNLNIDTNNLMLNSNELGVNLTSGVYFVTLMLNNKTVINKKLIIL